LAEKPAKSGDTAVAGTDGQRVNTLIDKAESDGTATMYQIVRDALTRHLSTDGGHWHLLANSSGMMFTPAQHSQLVDALAKTIATGDLLGRTRIREKLAKADGAKGLHRFAETDERPFAYLPGESIPLLTPDEAVRYFSSLVPSLGVDVLRYGPAMQRAAFTLARATETTILSRVQEIILRAVQTGEDWKTTPAAIDSILTEAGIHPTNPQYSSMVFRTNVMDAFNVGQHLEVIDNPDVAAMFPAWQYLGIRDGREGEDHRPHFGLYYPTSISFHQVRGPRVFNCRCSPRYVDRYEWADLYSRGVRFSNDYAYQTAG
jgi:hypothetical protein